MLLRRSDENYSRFSLVKTKSNNVSITKKCKYVYRRSSKTLNNIDSMFDETVDCNMNIATRHLNVTLGDCYTTLFGTPYFVCQTLDSLSKS